MGTGTTSELLTFVGLSIVAALLVTSILSEFGSGTGFVRAGIALLPTEIIAVRSGDLGLMVLAGTAAYWLVSLML